MDEFCHQCSYIYISLVFHSHISKYTNMPDIQKYLYPPAKSRYRIISLKHSSGSYSEKKMFNYPPDES